MQPVDAPSVVAEAVANQGSLKRVRPTHFIYDRTDNFYDWLNLPRYRCPMR